MKHHHRKLYILSMVNSSFSIRDWPVTQHMIILISDPYHQQTEALLKRKLIEVTFTIQRIAVVVSGTSEFGNKPGQDHHLPMTNNGMMESPLVIVSFVIMSS